MRGLTQLVPADAASGENARAVQMMRWTLALKDRFSGQAFRRAIQRLGQRQAWPVVNGAYAVGDPGAPVAICTLTSTELVELLAGLPGVAIAGRTYTPNLGIERILLNVTANPAIRFLLVCGKESPIFQPGQALEALCHDGMTSDRRIVGAEGYFPVLANIPPERVEVFRRQVELVGLPGEMKPDAIRAQVRALVERTPGPYLEAWTDDGAGSSRATTVEKLDVDRQQFKSLRPGGRRQPLAYDPRGFFVITLSRKRNQIVLRHYLPDNSPAHEMRGRSAEAILLGLLREGLISQMSHAGYLGYELAKAETALRLGLSYEQDQPLRARSG